MKRKEEKEGRNGNMKKKEEGGGKEGMGIRRKRRKE